MGYGYNGEIKNRNGMEIVLYCGSIVFYAALIVSSFSRAVYNGIEFLRDSNITPVDGTLSPGRNETANNKETTDGLQMLLSVLKHSFFICCTALK